MQARDASGNPAANVPLTWTVTPLQGTVPNPPSRTDANGMASAYYNGNVTPGYSFSQQTVTVSSSLGSVNFVVTTVLNVLPNGAQAAMPTVYVTAPPPENRTLSGRSGTTIAGAIAIQVGVQAGPQQGAPIPNVGVRIVDGDDPNATPAAHCATAPLTGESGIARCDLVLTAAQGTYSIRAVVGEFNTTAPVFLNIGAPNTCAYSSSATSQQFPAAGGIGTITVNTAAGCPWTAASNSNWIAVNAPNGAGYGGTAFTVSANAGAARSGSISVAGQTIAIDQAGVGGAAALSIATTSLPAGTAGSPYNAILAAGGGRPPYSWAASTLPAGLTLNPTAGTITGTPSAAGSYPVTLTVTDQAGGTQSQAFALTIVTGGGQPGSGLAITNTGFPAAVAGTAYRQILGSIGGCTSPFDAPPVFSITQGALPPGLSITMVDDRRSAITGTPTTAGGSNFTLTVTACKQSASAPFTLTVTGAGAGPGLSSTPPSVTFAATVGQSGNPADQTISLSGPAGASFSAVASALSGGNWLTIIGPATGTLPAVLTVRAVNPGTLTANTYSGNVAIASSAGPFNIPVTLTVAAPAAVLASSVSAINITVEAGSGPLQQVLTITNVNGGPVHFNVFPGTVNGGSWLSASSPSGDTPANLVITVNPSVLQAAPYTGALQLMPVNPIGATLVVPVNLRVLPPAGLSVSPSGLSFTIQAGQPLPPAQTIDVASTGVAVNSVVSATTTSGGTWLFVTPPVGMTPFISSVSVNPAGLLPGTYDGTLVVSSGTQVVTPVYIPVKLVIPQPVPAITAIVNAASFQAGAVSPGEIVTIYGSGIGPATLAASRVTAAGALDPTIGATRVLFDGIPAPMIYASNQQAATIVPYELDGKGATQIQVEYQGVLSSPVTLGVVPAVPAIFTFSSSGRGPAAALNQDNSYNLQNNGADPGSIVVLFATGEGQTDPGGVDGLLATTVLPVPKLQVTVTVGGEDAQVLYAGAAPALAAGLMQLNIVLPADLPHGVAVPVVLTVGGAPSPAGVTVFTK